MLKSVNISTSIFDFFMVTLFWCLYHCLILAGLRSTNISSPFGCKLILRVDVTICASVGKLNEVIHQISDANLSFCVVVLV